MSKHLTLPRVRGLSLRESNSCPPPQPDPTARPGHRTLGSPLLQFLFCSLLLQCCPGVTLTVPQILKLQEAQRYKPKCCRQKCSHHSVKETTSNLKGILRCPGKSSLGTLFRKTTKITKSSFSFDFWNMVLGSHSHLHYET